MAVDTLGAIDAILAQAGSAFPHRAASRGGGKHAQQVSLIRVRGGQ
jgi:hypothetical protein